MGAIHNVLEDLLDEHDLACITRRRVASVRRDRLSNRESTVLTRRFLQPTLRHIEPWPPDQLYAGNTRTYSQAAQIAASIVAYRLARQSEVTGAW
jgi:hypothetical protein